MEPEPQAPKKRVYRRKTTPASADILNVVADLEGESAPKTKRAYKRKSVVKSEVLDKPTIINVQHNTQTNSLRSAMPISKVETEDPFAILDKELEFKDFFTKFENPKSSELAKASTVNSVESIKKTRNPNFDDLEDTETLPSKSRFLKLLKYLVALTIVLAGSYYAYNYLAVKFAEKDSLSLLKEVALVPEGERPLIYSVTDATELLKNPLFSKVEKGDKVFVFEKSGQVYVYRDSVNRLVTIVNAPDTKKTDTTEVSATSTSETSTTSSEVASTTEITPKTKAATTTSKTTNKK